MKTKQVALETPDVQMIALDQIHPSLLNPRKRFDEEGIGELAASIAEHGLLQPITVAPWTDGYVIVAGERRWRACSQLQLATVPCIIRPVGTDKEHLQLALIENLQRADAYAWQTAIIGTRRAGSSGGSVGAGGAGSDHGQGAQERDSA